MKYLFKSICSLAAALLCFGAAAQSWSALQKTSSPADLVDGMFPGVSVSSLDGNPNGSASVIIRGVNTLRGDSQPLWIVDGVILNNSLNQNLDAFYLYPEKSYTSPLNSMGFLDPYQIESIEVLKDVSATALYGSLGANGVIIITTKKSGEAAINFDWNSNVGVNFATTGRKSFVPAATHNHHFRLHGTSGNAQYSISAFLNDDDGVVKGTGNMSGGLSASLESTGNKLVTIGMNTNLFLGDYDSASGANYFGESSTMIAARKDNGEMPGWLSGYDDDALDFRTVNSLWLNFNLHKYLKWKTTLGIDFEDNSRSIFYGDSTPFGAQMNRAAAMVQSSMLRYNLSSVFQYQQYFNTKHRLSATLGGGLTSTLNRFNTLVGTDYFTEELRGKGISLAASERPIHRFEHTHSQYNLALTLGYDYNEVTGIDASLRIDTTPRYDDWKPSLFYGVTAYGNFKKLLMPEVKAVSEFRLEAGYGRAGNEQYIPYRLLGNYTAGGYPVAEEGTEEYYEGMSFLRSSEVHAGISMAFLDSRLKAGVTYFYKTTDDRLDTYCFGKLQGKLWNRCPRIDLTSFGSRIGNAGVETYISGDVIRTQKVCWNINANFTYSRNAILALDPNDVYGKQVGSGLYCNMNAAGYPVGSLIGVTVDKDGNYIDVTGDGQISEEDKQFIGNPFPKFYGSLGSTLTAGRWSAELLLTGAAGYNVMNLNSLLEGTAPYVVSQKCIEDGSHLTLKRVGVAYSFNMDKVKAIRELRLSLSGFNLLTLSSYKAWNPAVSCFGMSTLAAGVDYGSFPVCRSVVIGMGIKF